MNPNLVLSTSGSNPTPLLLLQLLIFSPSTIPVNAMVVCKCRKQLLQSKNQGCDGVASELSCVMKFGGSSVASAERMRKLADLILRFPEERPVIVLSAMGKTTNQLLLAGEKAVSCGVSNVSDIDELAFLKELHLKTADELGVNRSIISTHIEELEQLLMGISMMKELTQRTKDYLVSFGECMSTRIFAAYLNKIGVKAQQREET